MGRLVERTYPFDARIRNVRRDVINIEVGDKTAMTPTRFLLAVHEKDNAVGQIFITENIEDLVKVRDALNKIIKNFKPEAYEDNC